MAQFLACIDMKKGMVNRAIAACVNLLQVQKTTYTTSTWLLFSMGIETWHSDSSSLFKYFSSFSIIVKQRILRAWNLVEVLGGASLLLSLSSCVHKGLKRLLSVYSHRGRH